MAEEETKDFAKFSKNLFYKRFVEKDGSKERTREKGLREIIGFFGDMGIFRPKIQTAIGVILNGSSRFRLKNADKIIESCIKEAEKRGYKTDGDTALYLKSVLYGRRLILQLDKNKNKKKKSDTIQPAPPFGRK